MPSKSDLLQMQSLPLSAKVVKTQMRIREWYEHFDGNVYVAFSGGKDSTVLAHIVKEMYPDVPLVFSNTGLEYPEIQAFAKKMGAEFIRPKMMFSDVISTFGYPVITKQVAEAIHYARKIRNTGEGELIQGGRIGWRRAVLNGGLHKDVEENGEVITKRSIFNKEKWLPLAQQTQFKISHMCCDVMKKSPLHIYEMRTKRKPIIGTLADESIRRENLWIKNGCNAFNVREPKSQPLSFWREQDILKYISDNGYEIASVYGDIVSVDDSGFEYMPILGAGCKLKCTGCQRSGCIFCGFGCYLDKGESRFQMLAKTHPRQYEYCMRGGNGLTIPIMTLPLRNMMANG